MDDEKPDVADAVISMPKFYGPMSLIHLKKRDVPEGAPAFTFRVDFSNVGVDESTEGNKDGE